MKILHVGMDFNVEHMAAICARLIDGKLYIFKEYHDYYDTPELISAIQFDFPDDKVICYPDASGTKRGSTDASISDIALLRRAKFSIRARSKNPFIKDRIASVNNAFNKKKLFIDTERCPEITEALEQQIYTPNGQPDKKSGLDHISDAIGYLVYYLMPIRELKPQTRGIVA